MFGDKPQNSIMNTQWLFDRRLEFLGPQFELTESKNKSKIHQKRITDALLRRYTEIQSQEEIKQIFKLLNSFLLDFWCYDEANEKSKGGKSQVTKKKHTKEIQKQNNRVKKFLQMFKIDGNEEEEWRKIIKEKNVTNLLKNVYKTFFYILTYNFELVEKLTQSSSQNNQTIFEYQLSGFACFKNKQLPAQLKFRICILVLDVIRIIKTIRLAYLPQSEDEDQKQKFDSFFEGIKEPSNFSSLYRSFKNPNDHIFIQAMKQIKSQQSPQYKLWLDIEDIKKRYLLDQASGVLQIKTYKSKIQTTVAKQLELYWLFVASQYSNINFDRKDTEDISLYSIFEDYRYFYEHLIDQGAENQAKIQGILSFFNLVTGPWKELDYDSSLMFYWQCLLEVNTKVKLPLQYLTKNLDFIIETCHFKIESYEQQRNQQIKEQLKNILFSLSKELIQLSENQNFKRDYLQNNKRKVSQILSKFNHYRKVVGQMKLLVKQIKDSNIFIYLNEIQQKLNEKNIYLPILPYNEEQNILSKFQTIFQTDKDIVDEIKFFMNMANGSNLQQCCNYYKAKRQRFLKKRHIETESMNNMTFGITNSIRVAIFELITTIKLRENPQILQIGEIKSCLKQQRLEKLIQKLLRLYHRKNKYLRRENHLSTNQQDEEDELSLPFMKRISSSDINPNEFIIEQQFINELDKKDQDLNFEDNQFRLKLLKIISEIKIEMINKKVLQLDEIESPLQQEYELIKKRVYEHASKGLDFQNKQVLEILPKIEYEFTRKRFWPAWRKLTIIDKETLPEIQKLLEFSWGSENNILKFYVALLVKYRERQSQSKEVYLKMSEQQQMNIVNFVIQTYKLQGKERKRLKEGLQISMKILQNFEYFHLLQAAHKQQMQKIKSMEEAHEFHKVKNEYVYFKQLEGKLSIVQINKHGNPISKKYTITPIAKDYENVLKKLQKMTKLNKYITLTKEKRKIHLHVDQHQVEFQSYPKLVKYLMESYYQTVQFCYKNLQFQLYPIVWGKHIIIGKVKEDHLTLRFNPYQGIILNILLTFDELKKTKLFKYPQFPFVEFAEQINNLFMHSKQKIYSLQNQNAEYHAFVHLIQQMKSISLEQPDGDLQQTYKNILKCPYFWSSTQKFYELVEFKEKYHSNINIQQSRRKQNQKIRSELKKENDEQYQDLLNYLREPQKKQKHPHFKSMSSYNRTTQIYLSIEGLIQKQAFEEDIGNFRDKNSRGQLIPQNYKYHAYWWIKGKKQIEYLLEIVAEREKRRGSKKSSVYQKTFNSFQNQIRNLRNLAVHYIYDSKREKEITIEQKIRLFEQNFPKLFVFIYRWKPFVGKDYNTIQNEKIDLLCELFPNNQNNDVIQKLEGIKELEEYNIPNYKINKNQTSTLLQEFSYDRGRANGCYICGLISMLLYKQSSFWGFMSDAKYPKEKNGKQVLYNVLFWDHKTVGCNGMQYLERAFYNVWQRNQFTSQELAEIQNSEIMLKQQKQRIERKIIRLRNQQESSSDQQDRQFRQNRESVEVRYHKLTQDEKEQLHQELALTDYVPKYFVFQLEMRFPYFFYDLRRFRYLWDRRAKELPTITV